jgi:hypothetical protein
LYWYVASCEGSKKTFPRLQLPVPKYRYHKGLGGPMGLHNSAST